MTDGCVAAALSMPSLLPPSQHVIADWVHEGHVFCALDWQLVYRVVVDHLWDVVERLRKLTEDVATVSIGYYLEVHVPL